MQNKQHKPISHPVAVRLIEDIIDIIPEKKRGVYDRADPTGYSRGECQYRGLLFKYHDCTWGIELEIWTIPVDHRDGLLLANIYLDSGTGGHKKELIPRANWGHYWFTILHMLRPQMEQHFGKKSHQYLFRQYI